MNPNFARNCANSETLRNFERLNNEKITPYFLKMARSSKIDVSLDDLKNEQGNNFESEDNMHEHVTSYYENIYKKPNVLQHLIEGDNAPHDDQIENFLGDISEHPTVANAKLTEEENNALES